MAAKAQAGKPIMAATATQAGKATMATTATQAKFTIESDIVSAFKSRCSSEGISMASAVREFMRSGRPSKPFAIKTDTRAHRRETIQGIIGFLSEIMDSEACYRDSIPEQFTQRYESADEACERLSEAISTLEEVYL